MPQNRPPTTPRPPFPTPARVGPPATPEALAALRFADEPDEATDTEAQEAFNAAQRPDWGNPTEQEMSPWPDQPSDHLPPPEKVGGAGRWVAPTHPLGINGEKLPGAAPPPPPPLRPIDTLIRAVERAFTPRPERELDPEPPSWDEELYHWWVETARSDIRGSLDKIVQYGGRGAAYDLIATGHDLAALNGRQVDDEEATELAILFYASSKLNRLMAAAIDGRRGSDDSILDAAYYLMMMRRNRAVGGWPVGPHNKENNAE